MNIRILISIAVLSASICVGMGQNSEEEAVRAVIAREIDGWAKYDAKEVASVFSSDALWQNPFGVRLKGSAQLEKFLVRLFQRPGYRAAKDTDPPKITAIHFPSPTVAVVWSEESSKGQIDDLTGKPMGPRHSFYLEVLVKKDGAWKITESMIMDEINLAK